MIIRLPIDIKSLYLNIKNDNESGHTATVATPIIQYGGINEALIKVYDIPENINSYSKEGIISELLVKSRTEARIDKVFVFNKLSVNGERIENSCSFAMYVREETKEGYVHCGRKKLHYPTTLQYSDNEIEINNRLVMKAISEYLNNYAFIVDSFEYDTDTEILNFNIIIVGQKEIPYSKVFINRKGTGGKFTTVFSEEAESYDTEIIALREKLGYANVSPQNYASVMEKNRLLSDDIVFNYLQATGAVNIKNLTKEYPYALYNFEYSVGGVKQYLIVRFTATKIKYFNLPMTKIQFINDFSDKVRVCLITDINGVPAVNIYEQKSLDLMKKTLNSICYECTEE